ncbi:MAG TPA: penicillin-binding protein 2 [candidate division Zixibacteria bacterium]
MKDATYPREKRSAILISILAILLSLLIIRVFGLEVIRGTYYRQMSEENRIRPVPLPAPRGLIVDRNGKVIVSNRASYTVSIIPYEVRNLKEVVGRLSPLLQIDADGLMQRIKDNWSRRFEPITIKRDVDFTTISILEEQNQDFPGVIYQVVQTRKYPEIRSISHLIGYVSEISSQELASLPAQRYRVGSYIGKKGIEKQYDDLLRGKDGMLYLEVSAIGKILGELKDKEPDPPVAGSDIKLSINFDLQKLADSLLEKHSGATLVALDPNSGEILALVSKPGFDPNIFAGVLTPEEWNSLSQDPNHPLLDRAIQGTYPPGSTLKLLTAGAALETKVIQQENSFASCVGGYRFGNRIFKCWQERGHGKLKLHEAMVQSCDVYFYQLGLKVGLENWCHYAGLCGFGEKTGIDLPEEAKGFAPTLSYFIKRHGKGEWVKGLVINLAIGQGEISATPLQMATFYAGLANKGIIFKPHLLKQAITPSGKVFVTKTEQLIKLPFSPETLDTLNQVLIGVVNEPFGTGGASRLADVTVAGKTGTAQNPFGGDHAWFICYAPAEAPQIVLALLVENAGHGGTIAAPIAKRILQAFFEKNKELHPQGGVLNPNRDPESSSG